MIASGIWLQWLYQSFDSLLRSSKARSLQLERMPTEIYCRDKDLSSPGPNEQLAYVLGQMHKVGRLPQPMRAAPFLDAERTLIQQTNQRYLEYLETGGLGRDPEGTAE